MRCALWRGVGVLVALAGSGGCSDSDATGERGGAGADAAHDSAVDAASESVETDAEPSVDANAAPEDASTEPVADGDAPMDGDSIDSAQDVGDAGSEPSPDAATDAGQGGAEPFVLTSTAFSQGQTIPVQHTCDDANVSPPLAWGPGPAGTMSYAFVLTDLDNGSMVHWVMWDIPESTLSLPEDVDKVYLPPDVPGAKQTNSYAGARGYAGPCSPGSVNTYEFRLYAIGVATLPSVDMNSTRAQVLAVIQANDVDSIALDGES